MGCIYVLIDPLTEEVRYVGWTTKPLYTRLRWHLNCKGGVQRTRWIESLVERGLRPRIQVVQPVVQGMWGIAERYWIAYFRSIGCPLTNGTLGGEGSAGHHVGTQTRAKIGSYHRGKVISAEHKAIVSAATTLRWERWRADGRFTSEETRKKISTAKKGVPLTEAVRATMSDRLKGKPKSAAHRERIRQALLGRKQSPDHAAKTAINAAKATQARWGKEA